jgi:NAD kinase
VAKAAVHVKDIVRGQRDFWVRAECATDGDLAKAGLNAIGVDAIFQHNMFARPFLAPGKNQVTVRTANPETLDHDKLNVMWVWQEAGVEKKDSRRVTKSPTDYTIEVGGDEMPRMIRLEMSVLP